MKSFAIILLSLTLLVLVSACAKHVYVCYDGSTRDDQKKCPTVPVPTIDELAAGRAMDNYGNAVSQAKRDVYTRVNMYSQNGSYYSTVLFTNSGTGAIQKLLFRIDGKTADVTCVNGCDYIKK